MSQKQFEVVKCLFLAWNHLWCFRFVVVCFLFWFALKFVVSTIEIDGWPAINLKAGYVDKCLPLVPCLLVENYSNCVHAMTWMDRVMSRLLGSRKKLIILLMNRCWWHAQEPACLQLWHSGQSVVHDCYPSLFFALPPPRFEGQVGPLLLAVKTNALPYREYYYSTHSAVYLMGEESMFWQRIKYLFEYESRR